MGEKLNRRKNVIRSIIVAKQGGALSFPYCLDFILRNR